MEIVIEGVRATLGPGRGLPARRRPLELVHGATLAEAIFADRDLPPFDRVTMDGYAVRAADIQTGTKLRVTGAISAGQSPDVVVSQGECVAISTGAQLPEGADAVIPHELTDRGSPQVTINSPPIQRFHNVHRRAADAARGERLLQVGDVLDPARIAVAAAVGVVRPLVSGGRVSVRILSSGDEVRPAATATSELAPHQIRDSNAYALRTLAPLMGGLVESVRHVPDDPESTLAAVSEAIESVDVVVTVGGISAGAHDHFPEAFSMAGVTTHIRGVNMQPGRPVFVGRADGASLPGDEQFRPIIVALPGNPASVMVTAHLFLWPVLRLLAGIEGPLPWVDRPLAEEALPNPKRPSFRPAALDPSGGARVIPWSGSGDFVHLVHADGLVRLPAQANPIPAGGSAPFLPWAWYARPDMGMGQR